VLINDIFIRSFIASSLRVSHSYVCRSGVVVRALDFDSEGHEFDSRFRAFR